MSGSLRFYNQYVAVFSFGTPQHPELPSVSQTYSMHSDSVWALQSQTSDLSVVLSGGRDGCVYRTHIGSRTSELLLEEKGPVREI